MKACDHIWLFKWFTLACCMSHTYPKRKFVFLMGKSRVRNWRREGLLCYEVKQMFLPQSLERDIS